MVDRELRYRLRGIAATFEALLMRILREATERGWMDFDPREIDVVAHALPGMAVPGMLLVGDEQHDDLGKRADYLASARRSGVRGCLLARKGAPQRKRVTRVAMGKQSRREELPRRGAGRVRRERLRRDRGQGDHRARR